MMPAASSRLRTNRNSSLFAGKTDRAVLPVHIFAFQIGNVSLAFIGVQAIFSTALSLLGDTKSFTALLKLRGAVA
jgi:hypothetical protein